MVFTECIYPVEFLAVAVVVWSWSVGIRYHVCVAEFCHYFMHKFYTEFLTQNLICATEAFPSIVFPIPNDIVKWRFVAAAIQRRLISITIVPLFAKTPQLESSVLTHHEATYFRWTFIKPQNESIKMLSQSFSIFNAISIFCHGCSQFQILAVQRWVLSAKVIKMAMVVARK